MSVKTYIKLLKEIDLSQQYPDVSSRPVYPGKSEIQRGKRGKFNMNQHGIRLRTSERSCEIKRKFS